MKLCIYLSVHSPDEPCELAQCLKHDDSTINIILLIIIIIIIFYFFIFLFFFTPVLSAQGMKKLSYAKKNQAGMAITPRPPSQSYYEVEWH